MVPTVKLYSFKEKNPQRINDVIKNGSHEKLPFDLMSLSRLVLLLGPSLPAHGRAFHSSQGPSHTEALGTARSGISSLPLPHLPP